MAAKHFLVYMTACGDEEAGKIASTLVQERLAACANILGDIRSFYWWDGKVRSDPEVGLIAKTTGDKLQALIARVKSLHSYSLPCVVALEIAAGNPEFLAWIEQETESG